MNSTVPHWATSMISNYREAFKTEHGYEWPGDDVTLFGFCEANKGADDCDEWTIEDMERYVRRQP